MEEFDVIVCGAGSAGSTAAGLPAADDDLRVLVLEAGPDDEDERVADPDRWTENLGGERDWGFLTAPEAGLDGRRLLYSGTARSWPSSRRARATRAPTHPATPAKTKMVDLQ